MSVVCRYILATHTLLLTCSMLIGMQTASSHGSILLLLMVWFRVTLQWPELTLNVTAPTNTAIRSLQSVMAGTAGTQ